MHVLKSSQQLDNCFVLCTARKLKKRQQTLI